MGRHIIPTFQSMFVIRFAFLYQVIKNRFHIRTNIRISIFIDT